MAEDAATGAPGALDVLTILDLCEDEAGSYAARLFAAYGAEVIKVERPEAKDGGVRDAALHAGKLSITLDLDSTEGAALFSRLAEEADGIVEDAASRRRAGLGIDAATLIRRVPRLVIAGVASASAPPRRTGLHAFFATLAALWSAAQTEHGQVVLVDGDGAAAADAGPAVTSRLGGENAAPVEEAALEDGADPPFDLTETPPAGGEAARPGDQTDAVLGRLLGLDAAAIEGLRARGVV